MTGARDIRADLEPDVPDELVLLAERLEQSGPFLPRPSGATCVGD